MWYSAIKNSIPVPSHLNKFFFTDNFISFIILLFRILLCGGDYGKEMEDCWINQFVISYKFFLIIFENICVRT